MKENFPYSLGEVLKHEGEYVNDPADPGGETNKGITQYNYDAWRIGEGLPKRSVRFINDYEVGVIYKKLYWDLCSCDMLPTGVDYAVFDFAVNSGVHRASKYLQQVAAVTDDGVIGPFTIKMINALDPVTVIDALCALRDKFLERQPTFPRFGKGWENRVSDVDRAADAQAKAKAMINA